VGGGGVGGENPDLGRATTASSISHTVPAEGNIHVTFSPKGEGSVQKNRFAVKKIPFRGLLRCRRKAKRNLRRKEKKGKKYGGVRRNGKGEERDRIPLSGGVVL